MLNKFAKINLALLTAVACMGANAATGPVSVSISSAKAVLQSNDDVLVNVKFTNTSNVDQYVLKHSTPFGDASAPLFSVVRDGVQVPYVGKLVKRVAPSSGDYLVLKPGKSYTQQVELSAQYDMGATGNYSIRYQSASEHLFGKGGAQGLVASNSAGELASSSVSLWVNGHQNVAAPQAQTLASLAGSLSYTNCSSSRQTAIATAFSSAKTYANNALSYFNAGTNSTRYKTWFGTYSSTNYSTVKSHYSNMVSAMNGQPFVVDCSCTDAGTYAYVYPTQPYKIYVCGAFWNAPNTGTDSKAGTLVHESSHFNVIGKTQDYAYGQSAAKSLAISSPSKAIFNADSHEYFAENNPAQN
jgi:peptidyl-Lys metalloendopeptidase